MTPVSKSKSDFKAPLTLAQLSYFEIIGFVILFLSPLATFYFVEPLGLAQDQRLFLATLSSTLVMWIFRLFPDFIAGIFLLLMVLILGIVPAKTVLIGLSSETFILVMSVCSLTVVLTDSHIIPRILFTLLKRLPAHTFSYHFVLFFMGFILTPIIPSIVNRAQLMGNFLNHVFQIFNIKTANRNSTFLTFTAFIGTTSFSSVFLSSSLMNFIVLGFLPSQEQFQFQWLGWLKGSAIYGIVMLVASLLCVAFLSFSSSSITISKDYLNKELKSLGSFDKKEAMFLICTALFSLGILTFSFHKISLAWVSLSILFILLGTGLFTKRDFETRVDWAFLIFLSSAIGITACLNFLSFDTFFNNFLMPYKHYFVGNSYKFYLFIGLFTLVIRFILPIPAAVVLLCSILIPLALAYEFSTWITTFIVLVTSDAWFFPYQNFYYIAYDEDVSRHTPHRPYDQNTFLILNLLMTLVRFLGIYLSISYWRYIGLD